MFPLVVANSKELTAFSPITCPPSYSHHTLLLSLFFFFLQILLFLQIGLKYINSYTFWFSFPPTLPPPGHPKLSTAPRLVLYLKYSLFNRMYTHMWKQFLFNIMPKPSYFFLLTVAQHSNSTSCEYTPAYQNHDEVLRHLYHCWESVILTSKQRNPSVIVCFATYHWLLCIMVHSNSYHLSNSFTL